MSNLLLHDARLVQATGAPQRGWLWVRDRRIAAFGVGDPPDMDGQRIDAQGHLLLPGFIDIHTHGGMNADTMDADPDALRTMARYYAENGVTSFLATTWTDSRERTTAALKTIAETVGPIEGGATLVGAHLEGPYLNAEKCGAQNPEHIRRVNRDEALSWLDLDVIRLVALAPEFPENHWLISECVRRGITVSAAHTSATYDDMLGAIRRGLSHATHTFNAMSGLHHRDPGTLGAVLIDDRLHAELIADNVHVHPAAMKILYRAKGRDRVILVSDDIRAAGMPDGEYAVDDRTMIVKDGECRLPDGTLAGSIVRFNVAVRQFCQAVEEPLEMVWPVTSQNAARTVGVAHRKGTLTNGKDADLVLVDDDVNVLMTIAEGRIVYSAEGVTANA